MLSSLESYLDELSDQKKPLVTSRLANLSGLFSAEVSLLQRVWPKIEVERRRQIINRLVDLAQDNFELDFEPMFQACLKDSDQRVRVKAIEGLWECEDRSLIDPLISLLQEDSEESVRAAAAAALGKFAMLAEFEKLRSCDAEKVENALLAVIDNKMERLEVRRRAIEAISPRNHKRVKEIIREAYQSNSPKLRGSALYAMGRNCNPEWLPILVKELGSPNPELRFEAARACGELGDESVISHLIMLIHDPDPQVQDSAIEALGYIGGTEAGEALRQCRNNPDERIRHAAEAALQELGFADDPLSFRDIPLSS